MEEDGYDGADSSGTNHGRWTREEHAFFLHGLELHGKEWKKIADMINTRSVVQIRTHAQKYFQKLAKTTGGPVMSTSKKGDVVLRPPTRRRRLEHEDEDGNGDADSDEQGALGSGDDLAGGESEVSPGGAGGGLDGDEWRGSSKDEPGEPESGGSSSSSSLLRGGGGPPGARKPGSIKVPVFRRPDETSAPGLGKLKVPVARPPAPPVAAAADDGGGITPRTVAAATILLRPRIQHKLATGSDTPKTRETASWLESHEARAAAVLGKRRRTATPNAATAAGAAPPSAALSWETAASNR